MKNKYTELFEKMETSKEEVIEEQFDKKDIVNLGGIASDLDEAFTDMERLAKKMKKNATDPKDKKNMDQLMKDMKKMSNMMNDVISSVIDITG